MRVVEAAAGGLVTTIVAVLVAARFELGGDLVVVGAIGFLAAFLAVLMRSDRSYVENRRR
jgi:hypothetical protein